MSNGEIRVSITEIPKIREALEKANKEIEELNNIIEEQDKELELERKSRQLLTDDLANVCEMSLKKDNIIKEVREKIKNTKFAFDFDKEVKKLAFDLTYTKEGQELLEILDKAGDEK